MSRVIRILGVALLAIALSAAVGTGGADAKKKKVHGNVTITYERNTVGSDRFFGLVSSPNPRCARGAVVNLGYKPAFEGGGGSDIPRITVASTRADAQGNWQILYEVTPNGVSDFQSYSASSPIRHLKTHRRNVTLVCKFMTSEVLTLFPG